MAKENRQPMKALPEFVITTAGGLTLEGIVEDFS